MFLVPWGGTGAELDVYFLGQLSGGGDDIRMSMQSVGRGEPSQHGVRRIRRGIAAVIGNPAATRGSRVYPIGVTPGAGQVQRGLVAEQCESGRAAAPRSGPQESREVADRQIAGSFKMAPRFAWPALPWRTPDPWRRSAPASAQRASRAPRAASRIPAPESAISDEIPKQRRPPFHAQFYRLVVGDGSELEFCHDRLPCGSKTKPYAAIGIMLFFCICSLSMVLSKFGRHSSVQSS